MAVFAFARRDPRTSNPTVTLSVVTASNGRGARSAGCPNMHWPPEMLTPHFRHIDGPFTGVIVDYNTSQGDEMEALQKVLFAVFEAILSEKQAANDVLQESEEKAA